LVRVREVTDGHLDAPTGRSAVQGRHELSKLHTGTITVDGVDDVEQRRAGHPPGYQKDGIGLAKIDLREKRNVRVIRQEGQNPDLVTYP